MKSIMFGAERFNWDSSGGIPFISPKCKEGVQTPRGARASEVGDDFATVPTESSPPESVEQSRHGKEIIVRPVPDAGQPEEPIVMYIHQSDRNLPA